MNEAVIAEAVRLAKTNPELAIQKLAAEIRRQHDEIAGLRDGISKAFDAIAALKKQIEK